MRRFPESEYRVPFFDEYGYVRRLCPVCNEYFWTQNIGQKTCGEATPEGCAPYTFINQPPTRRRYSLREMREAFLSFFERCGHERIKPYPVVARWRDDLYFTSASIVDFQPYVTNGIIPPPANPLVISQPCIRFVDMDNVGPTFGRHLTIFEMGGHHAFNYPDKEVYWKDETVRYHHEFLTKELGAPSEEVIYKEGVWSGGGNAGPDVESIIRGLEVATLVFMKFKVVGEEFIELPIRTVDTGYGIERYTWLSQGSVSCFHAVYGPVLDGILRMAGMSGINNELLARTVELSSLMSLEKTADTRDARRRIAEQVGMSVDALNRMLTPIENAFAVADHTKCLVFMLAEGVVPSNVREGYLTRLMIRRTYRLLRALAIEEKLLDIIDLQITFWSQDFPHLKEMHDEIIEILSVERNKFKETLKRGGSLVKRITQGLKAKAISQIPTETLVELYDSHGLSPEVVKETAEKESVQVSIPENFYMMVAKKHVQAPPPKEVETPKGLEAMVSDLAETRMLYYENPYLTEFEARVLRVLDDQFVVLEKTAFYPEGGGQPADRGYLRFDGTRSEVADVQKTGNVIAHVVKGPTPREGDKVFGFIDWDWRSSLMKHHTSTHVLMGAARRVLGEHVWQAGAQKGFDKSRIDISHFQRLTLEEIHEIERLANQAVMQNIPVGTSWLPREQAEKQYGFRLYQGGVVPGREIRVVKIGDWDVEACGGTHLKNTGEIGFIKIVHTERIQDGVERILFSAGLPALRAVQENESLLWKVSGVLNAPIEKVEKTTERMVTEWKEARREVERLRKRESEAKAKEYLAGSKPIHEVKVVIQPVEGAIDVRSLIDISGWIAHSEPNSVTVLGSVIEDNSRIVVAAGPGAIDAGINAREIAREAASVLGGGGSGRPDFAQGGGTLIDKVPEALLKAEEIIRRQLKVEE
ncbi:MAG: Alanine--tRNA ligase [Candidatus Bathyarchaeota archaeon BA1]|nr:MAG: Alanine--tRNA ligase [Candidatus Bathyarchaeota archaeon BA1]